MDRYVWEIIRYTFSLRFLVALFYSFAYYIHEHVVWRAKLHAAKDARIHATASIRNAQNVYVGKILTSTTCAVSGLVKTPKSSWVTIS